MKKFAKWFWNYIEGLNGIIFILYTIFISSTYAFITTAATPAPVFSYSVKGFNITGNVFLLVYFVRNVLIITLLCIILAPPLLRFIKRLTVKCKEEQLSVFFKAAFYLVPLICLLFLYIAYYPGGFSIDSARQYTQAVDNVYNDWHPVIQTLFTFKLPLLITGGWTGSIILFQIIEFSAVVGYSLTTLSEYTNKWFALFALAFIVLNPQTGNILMYPWKDGSFAMGALLMVAFALNIVFTKGEWLKSPWHIAAFVVVTALTTLFRHNALLFTVPFLIVVLLFTAKKRGAIVLIGVIALAAGIKYPLYSAIKVEKNETQLVELMGVPMNVIGAVVVNNPDALDDETKEFAYKVAPEEIWKTKYVYGDFNDVKWNEKTNSSVIEEYGAKRIVKMMLRCFIHSPKEAIMGFIKLTEVAYTVTDNYIAGNQPYIVNDKYEIKQGGVPILRTLNLLYTAFAQFFLPHLFLYAGSMHLILLAAALAKRKLKRLSDIKDILLVIPVFIYNFGTMLLLTGINDSSRFFFYTFLITPLLSAVFFTDYERKALKGNNEK